MNINDVMRRLISLSGDKVVIAIDGYSGAGKTTLLKQLAKQNKAVLPVFLDDFMNTGRKRRALLRTAKDKRKVFELEWNNTKKVLQLLNAYRKRTGLYTMNLYNPKSDRYDRKHIFDLSKQFLVLEGVFLFNQKLYRNAFDVRIFLDTNTKIADARRIERERKRWGKKYVDENRPDSFVFLFKRAYASYIKRYHPKEVADFVVKPAQNK